MVHQLHAIQCACVPPFPFAEEGAPEETDLTEALTHILASPTVNPALWLHPRPLLGTAPRTQASSTVGTATALLPPNVLLSPGTAGIFNALHAPSGWLSPGVAGSAKAAGSSNTQLLPNSAGDANTLPPPNVLLSHNGEGGANEIEIPRALASSHGSVSAVKFGNGVYLLKPSSHSHSSDFVARLGGFSWTNWGFYRF